MRCQCQSISACFMSLLSYGFLDQSICVLKQRATVPHLSCVTTTLFGLGWGLSKSYHSSPWHRVVSIISRIPIVCPRWDPSVEGQRPGLHRHADSDGWQPSVEWTQPSMLQSKEKRECFFSNSKENIFMKIHENNELQPFCEYFEWKEKMHILQTVGQALHLRPVLLAVHNVPKTTRTKFPSDDAEVLLCALPVKSKSLPQWLRLGDFQKPWIAGKNPSHQ